MKPCTCARCKSLVARASAEQQSTQFAALPCAQFLLFLLAPLSSGNLGMCEVSGFPTAPSSPEILSRVFRPDSSLGYRALVGRDSLCCSYSFLRAATAAHGARMLAAPASFLNRCRHCVPLLRRHGVRVRPAPCRFCFRLSVRPRPRTAVQPSSVHRGRWRPRHCRLPRGEAARDAFRSRQGPRHLLPRHLHHRSSLCPPR